MKKLMLLVLLTGCSDAEVSRKFAMGAAEVVCYSGGQVVYRGESTGRVEAEDASDGWYFQEKGTNDFVRISGTCVIRNK